MGRSGKGHRFCSGKLRCTGDSMGEGSFLAGKEVRRFVVFFVIAVCYDYVESDKIAEENVLAPAPTRFDEQILPVNACFQLDEQWFTLNVDLLRKALEITPIHSAHPFESPPAGEQPWRAMLSLINQCLTDKTSGSDKPRTCSSNVMGHNIYRRPASPVHVTGDDFLLAPIDRKAIREPVVGITRKLLDVEGKEKGIATNEKAAQSLPDLQKPKKKNDTFANVVRDNPSPADAETGADMEKTNSEAATEILDVGDEQGEDVSNMVALKERVVELDEGQAGSDSGKTPESRPLPQRVLMEEDQPWTKSWKSYIETEVESMVIVPVHQASSSAPLLSILVIDLLPLKLVYSPVQELVITATTETTTTTLLLPPPPLLQGSTNPELATHVSALEKICATFEKKHKLQDKTTQALSSGVYTLENHDLYSKIEKYVNEVVKEAVQNALQAPLRERFKELSEVEMKEILQDLMFKSGSYISHPEHTALYDALELSMDCDNMEEFKEATAKSRKRRRDDQDPSPPLPKDFDQSKKRNHDSNASASKQPSANALAKTYKDLKEHKLLRKIGDMVLSSNGTANGLGRRSSSKLTWKIDLVNPEGNRVVPDVSKPLPLEGPPDFGLEELVPSLWIESERDYDISAAYDISHWWFKRKEFYITRHSAPSDRRIVRSHMRILSVVSLKTVSRYRDRNNQMKMMRETEVHKFSDDTLTRILEKLDVMVKDYVLFKFNPGMEHRIWTEDDKMRSQKFIKVIKSSLKIRRIFRSLESFNRRDLPGDNPLVSVEVLRYDIKRSKSENKGIVPTEMELVLEQTQRCTSHEVSVSTEGVEE
uniref:Uncharacterized protein n=1 Tax=Tanacetum cinerariifolium TaxID=118510 RepID=A0A699GLL9_TANCI|nr:hypothetical protein [Tanacetum cinerariifolium]